MLLKKLETLCRIPQNPHLRIRSLKGGPTRNYNENSSDSDEKQKFNPELFHYSSRLNFKFKFLHHNFANKFKRK
jgi:hypothetical protein